MDSELRSQAARYVQLLRRSGQKDAWLPAGLTRRLPTGSDRTAVAQPLRARDGTISDVPSTSSSSHPQSAMRKPIEIPAGTKAERLAALKKQTATCTLCPHLAKSRTQVVFGVGNPEAKLMFVGEAPGADEDEQGEPFVGRAGQLLTKMITAMELTREQVYIANVLKCRPDMPANSSGNRKPTRGEMDTCLPYLRAQVAVIAPQVIVALGATAVEGLFGPQKANISRLRGNWRELDGVPVRPTFHPSYLLYNQDISLKRLVWEDLLAAMERLALPISEKQRGFFLKP
jgi:uracil-DNA glycosylase family 4